MKGALHISGREFRGYFVSPVAYIVISVFLAVTGWFFFSTFFLYGQANLRNFFSLLPITFAFIVPAVTMRLFSEEMNTGSYELLLTMPVSSADIVLGKFLGALAFVAVMLLPTFVYAVVISFLGQLDWGPVIGGYVGAIFLGGAFSAVGLFTSSLTRNQIVAFIIGMAVCLALTLVDRMLFFLPRSALGVLQFLGADYHFRNIAKGVIDSRDILYFLSVCFVMLYGAGLAIEGKK
jgi:ABC-2 type transport system permease protein